MDNLSDEFYLSSLLIVPKQSKFSSKVLVIKNYLFFSLTKVLGLQLTHE